MKKFTTPLLFTLCLALCLASCGKKEQPSTQTDFEQGMTGEDTLQVQNLVAQYFDAAEKGDYATAAGLLYKVNPEKPFDQPEPLDNEELQKALALLKAIPIVDYRIEYMKFSESQENEVMCTVTMERGQNGEPDVTTKMFFKPVNYLGAWMLCMMNSTTGDIPVLTPDQRDSMSLEYRTEMRTKQEAAERREKAEKASQNDGKKSSARQNEKFGL